jgi:hypothetical protein
MKEKFINKRFSTKCHKTIEQANAIITDYRSQGFSLTLRQLYYQFVSRDLIKNNISEYKKLGYVINDARLAGLIDWDAIEDRTRNLKTFYFSELGSPSSILEGAAYGHELDHWADQPTYCEVWIEKEALVGVIENVCNRWRVPYYACKGYNSQSEQYGAGKRIMGKVAEGKKVTILHLGDHDPSGMHMTVDNKDRLSMFSGGNVKVKRLGLNMDQVKKYDPPPNPAKETDRRFNGYVKKFGKKCWELDALEPKVINAIVEKNIKALIDDKLWKKTDRREEREKDAMLEIARSI